MTKPLNQLLEEAMKKCDSTMKETIDDYLYLRKEASNDLDELRKALLENDAFGLCKEVFDFLQKNGFNPFYVPSIDEFSKHKGGCYLVKKISKYFNGLKKFRYRYADYLKTKFPDLLSNMKITNE
jgi:hypothetical protein